jgi:pilus assembly protein CpaE
MKRAAVVVLSARREWGLALARRIEGLGAVRLQALASDAGSLRDALETQRPAALVADLGQASDRMLAALEAVPEPRPLLFVCGPPDDARLVLRAMRLGAREYLGEDPDSDALRAAFAQLRETGAAPEPAAAAAHVIAVLGAKGGVGTTFVASQLAVVLCAAAGKTALLDLAQPPGDAALHLDLKPGYGLARAACETATLDATFLRTLLCPHPSGVQFLAASERAEDAELLRPESLERAIALLRSDFDWLVLDLGRGWTEGCVSALDFVSHVLLVTQADVPALVNARRQLDLLERLGIASERVHVVENRQGRADAIPERDMKRFLGRAVEVRLPEDPAAVLCANEGRTLSEAAPYGHAQRALVSLARSVAVWCGREERPPARTSLLERVRAGLSRRNDGAA